MFGLRDEVLSSFGRDEIWRSSHYYLSQNAKFDLDEEMVLVQHHHFKMRIVIDNEQEIFRGERGRGLNNIYFRRTIFSNRLQY